MNREIFSLKGQLLHFVSHSLLSMIFNFSLTEFMDGMANSLTSSDSPHSPSMVFATTISRSTFAYSRCRARSKTFAEEIATVTSHKVQCDRQVDRHDHILLLKLPWAIERSDEFRNK